MLELMAALNCIATDQCDETFVSNSHDVTIAFRVVRIGLSCSSSDAFVGFISIHQIRGSKREWLCHVLTT